MKYPITLRPGSLAYYDGLRGLVPCKVLSIVWKGYYMVAVRITAKRAGFEKGEVLRENPAYRIFPRRAVHGKYMTLVAPYEVSEV